MKNLNKVQTILRHGALLTILLGASWAQGTPIMGPVLRVEGDSTYTERGGAAAVALREHDRVQTGGTIITSKRAEFSPMPMSVVQLEGNGQLTIQKLDRVMEGGQITSRETALSLNRGSLVFAIEAMNSARTSFQVETPRGTLTAGEASGSISFVAGQLSVVACEGNIAFRPTSGPAVNLTPGSVFTAFESGDVAGQTVNLLNRTVTTISRDGTSTTAAATPAQVQTAAASFQSAISGALASADSAGSRGLMSSNARPRIETTVASVNQSLNAAGVGGITAPVLTAGRPRTAFARTAWPDVANPANTSGAVASPEQ